jgi:hypothetical protein
VSDNDLRRTHALLFVNPFSMPTNGFLSEHPALRSLSLTCFVISKAHESNSYAESRHVRAPIQVAVPLASREIKAGIHPAARATSMEHELCESRRTNSETHHASKPYLKCQDGTGRDAQNRPDVG